MEEPCDMEKAICYHMCGKSRTDILASWHVYFQEIDWTGSAAPGQTIPCGDSLIVIGRALP